MTIDSSQPDGRRRVALVWAIRLVALAALAVAGYLLYSTGLRRAAPLGCGPASSCDFVLSSRWSRVFGLPVTLGALIVYAGVMAATIYASPAAKPSQQRVAWRVLVGLGGILLAVAAWFTTLQLVVLRSVCPWCMGEHALGVLTAGLVFAGAWRGGVGPKWGVIGAVAGLLAAAGLVAAQVLAPVTYTIRTHHGEVSLDLRHEPMHGSPDAPHVIGIMTDYTCPFCRMLSQSMGDIRRRYGRQVAIAVLPTPYEADCNPAVQKTPARHQGACELGRIALAVWIARPDKFEQMEQWLFEPADPRRPEDARVHAIELIGQEAFVKAKADPRVDQTIARNVKLYGELPVEALPVLLVGNAVLEGLPADPGLKKIDLPMLFGTIERRLPVRPVAPTTRP